MKKVIFFLESYAWTWKTLSSKRIDIKKENIEFDEIGHFVTTKITFASPCV